MELNVACRDGLALGFWDDSPLEWEETPDVAKVPYVRGDLLPYTKAPELVVGMDLAMGPSHTVVAEVRGGKVKRILEVSEELKEDLATDLRVAAGAFHRSAWEDSAHRRLLNRAADFIDSQTTSCALDEVEDPCPIPVGAPGSIMRRAWDLGCRLRDAVRELAVANAKLAGK